MSKKDRYINRAEQIIDILLKDKNVPQESLDEICSWLANSDENGEITEAFVKKCSEALKYEDDPGRMAHIWTKIAARLGLEAPAQPAPKIPLYRRTYFRVASAAAIVAVVLGVAFFGDFRGDAVGGGDGPVLVAVVKEVVVETVAGVQKEVVLADSTRVWLNGGSRMTYPETFAENERHVELEGEAWFEVAHNAEKPFHVHTEKLEVRVLGTKFNVAGGEAATEVTLHEGSVEVLIGELSRRLVPNERLTHSHATGEMIVAAIDPEAMQAADWRTDKISAHDKTVPEIVRMIENYYDVKIVIEAETLPDERYSLDFGKNETAETALTVLSRVSNSFIFEKQNDTITIYSKH